MTLKPARFRRLRKFWCWFAVQHHWTAVRRSFFEDRYGKTGVTPEPGKFTYEDPPTWIEAPNGALACMTCGRLKDWLYVPNGANLDHPVWIPPRYRHKPTCPLCLSRAYDVVFAVCDACGVTGEMLAREGLR